MQSIILASVFLLICAVQQGSAIKCYRCNSHSDQGCDNDKPPPEYLKECSEIQTASKHKTGFLYCRKITQIIEFSVNNLPPDNRVIRSCGFENQTKINYCYQRAGFGGRQIVCSCEEDGCNSSGTLKTSFLLYTLAAGLILFVSLFVRKV